MNIKKILLVVMALVFCSNVAQEKKGGWQGYLNWIRGVFTGRTPVEQQERKTWTDYEREAERFSRRREPGVAGLWPRSYQDSLAGTTIRGALQLTGHTSKITAVAFTPDGRRVITGSFDGVIKVWDVQTGTVLQTLMGHRQEVRSVAFSSDGRYLATGSLDGDIKIWDMHGNLLRTLAGHTGAVNEVAFGPNDTLASVSSDGTLKLWRVDDGTEVRTVARDQRGFKTLSFTPDGKYLVAGTLTGEIKLWDTENFKLLHTLRRGSGIIHKVVFSQHKRPLTRGFIYTLATIASSEQAVQIWHVVPRVSGIVVAQLKLLSQLRAESFGTVALSPDGKYAITGFWDTDIAVVWEMETAIPHKVLRGHRYSVEAVAFSPDGRRVITGSLDKTARIWDIGDDKTSPKRAEPTEQRGGGFLDLFKR